MFSDSISNFPEEQLLLQMFNLGSQCSVGWYGPTCQYQCHCAGSAPCYKHDGSCSSGCEIGWFGSACQYESIGFTVLGNSKLDWLTDQNDTTCNDDKETPVYLALKPPIPLGWSRIVVDSPGILNGPHIFYLQIENNGVCSFIRFTEG
ncbi:hypothetical protein RRG08_065509 [Elysia crispata]|uniref:Uncharacterized protein n=1 Tax=Elysia crispata TaxID=231223 RepID=A0AAE0ZUQ2_9GAST|nr:hypothetical protein RRG08_065509 [Elysia crispata]